MQTSQKTILSLLIAILFLGAFSALAFTGLFDLLEIRFYNPAVTFSITRDTEQKAESVDRFLGRMQNLCSGILNTQEFRYELYSGQNGEDILNRALIQTHLAEAFNWVQWIHFIDSDGAQIHFPSSGETPDAQAPLHSAYNGNRPFPEEVLVAEGENPKFIFDEEANRVLLTFPLYDSFDIYWGTAIFSLSTNAVSAQLVSEGQMSFGQDLTVVSEPQGILFGILDAAQVPPSQIAAVWRQEGEKAVSLRSEGAGLSLALISVKSPMGFFVGRLVNEEIFTLSNAMRIVLLLTASITVFLVVFLLLNLRQDPVAIVQNRIKKLQISLIEQFCELKGESIRIRWIRELESRGDEIAAQLKKGAEEVPDAVSGNIDNLIRKSWDEFIELLGGRGENGIDEEKLRDILKRALADTAALPALKPAPESGRSAGGDLPSGGKQGLLQRAAAIVKEIEETDELEELEEDEGIAAESPLGKAAENEPDILDENLEYLISKIEFDVDDEKPDSPEDDSIEKDLEIVSPFSSILDDLSTKSDEPESGGQKPGGHSVIVEREGVHHVNEELLNQDAESAALNRDFKDLVDSVIKK